MNKRGLGKGLGALIPENEEAAGNGVMEIKVTDIEPNENQPRRHFRDDELNSLAESIKEHGVVQPIILRKLESGYQIVAGERRWRASRIAGLKTVPAIIKDYSNVQVMEIALIENLQREDLNPIEEANAYKSLLDEYNMTQEDISKRIGKSRPAIANSLRLLSLPGTITNMVVEGNISAGHARALLTVGDEKRQLELARLIVEKGLSVRETEKLASQVKTEKPAKKEKSFEIIDLEERLKNSLGTKVIINHNQKKSKGKIEIEYYSNDDLERILELLEK